MNDNTSHSTHSDADSTLKSARPARNHNEEATAEEDAKMAIIGQYHMSGATSPRAMVPTIQSEAFMFLKSIFRKFRRKGS